MVNTAFVQCAGTNGVDSVLIAHIVVMHVPVYLGFGGTGENRARADRPL